ncbi:MAG: autotransporter-associated beta strand repeat-containing protein, partial [Akkermansia sp.]
MKLCIRSLSLRRALMLALSACCAQTLYAGVLQEEVGWNNYLDFGRNLAQFKAGATDVKVYNDEGEVVSTIAVVPDLSAMRDNVNCSGAVAGSQATMVTCGHDYQTSSVSFYKKATLNSLYAETYAIIGKTSGNAFPKSDMRVSRLDKVVTDAYAWSLSEERSVSDFYSTSLDGSEPTFIQVGSGTNYFGDLSTGEQAWISGAYAFLTAGTYDLTGTATQYNQTLTNDDGETFTANFYSFSFKYVGVSEDNPMPKSATAGDSGSPIIYFNESDQQWYYVGPLCSGSTWAGTSYMGYDTYDWYVEGYTTTMNLEGESTFNVSTDSDGLISLVGQTGGQIITTQGLADQYRSSTSTIGTAASSDMLMTTKDWAVSMNGVSFDFTDEVDTGAGIIYFFRDQDANGNDLAWTEYTLTSSNGEGIFNTGGYQVDEQVYLTTSLTGRAGDEWRMVGEVADMRDGTYKMYGGIVEITGKGDNQADLNLGIGLTVILNRTDGFACNDVRLNTMSHLILGGEKQIGGAVSIGVGGGTFDLNGYDFAATSDTFTALNDDAIVANTGLGTTSTFSFSSSGESIYQGSFSDSLAMGQEDGGMLNIVFKGGETGSWLLQGVSAISGSLTIESGTVEMSGFQTLHASGSLGGGLTTTTVEGDWTNGTFVSESINISDGASLAITQHVSVQADVEAGSNTNFSVASGTSFSGLITSSGSVSFATGSTINSDHITINRGGSLNLDSDYVLKAPLTTSGGLNMAQGATIIGQVDILTGASLSLHDGVTFDGDVNMQSSQSIRDTTTVTGSLNLINDATLTIYSDDFADFTTMEWGSFIADESTNLLFDINLSTMLEDGQYTLITTGGGLQFDGNMDLTGLLTSPTLRQDFSLSSDSNNIYLNVSGYSLDLTWSGSNGATWSMNGGNWTSQDGEDIFLSLDTAIFSGAGGLSVSLSGELDPYQAVIDSTGSYTFTGSGELTSITELIVKRGTLNLNNSNNHFGGTTVGGQGYAATLTTSTEGSLGTGVFTVGDQGTAWLYAAQNVSMTQVLAGGTLNINNIAALRSGELVNEGTVKFNLGGTLTQDITNRGLIQWSNTSTFTYSTGDFIMQDGASLNLTFGTGKVIINNITLSGEQNWNIASGQYLLFGKENTNNQGAVSVDGRTDVTITGGGMVILDLLDIEAMSTDLSWTISGGSTLAATNKGLGRLVTLNTGTLQLNYAALGGSKGSVGSWTLDAGMDLAVESGGGTINFYLPATATRTFGLAGDVSGTGDLTIQTTGATSGSSLNYTFSGDMSAYSGTLTLNGSSSTTSILTLTNAHLHTGDLVLNGSSSRVIFDSSSDQTMVGNISGSGALIQSGKGTLTLSGNNSYTGGTTLSDGTLRTDNINALGVNGNLSMASGTTLELLSDLSIGRMSMAGGDLQLHLAGNDAATLSMDNFSYSSSAALAVYLDLSAFDGSLGEYELIVSDSGFGSMTLDNFALGMFGYDETPVNYSFELRGNALVLHVTGSTIWAGADPWTSDFGSVVEFTDATDGQVIMQGDIDSTDAVHSSGTHTFVISEDGSGALTDESSLTITGGSLTLSSENSFRGNLTIDGGELLSSVDNSMGTGQLRVKDGGTIHLTTAQNFSATQVDAGGELYLNVANSLGIGDVNNEGTLTWEGGESATYTQNITSTGLINITGTGDFIHSTAALNMGDGASVHIASGAGDFLIANLALNGTQDWVIAEGETLRVGTSGTNNEGVLTVNSNTTINLSGGGMAIFDLEETGAISTNLNWHISGGSTIASTTAGFGGSVTLDDGTIQANYAAVGGGNASVGNWVYGEDMSISVLDGGGTIEFYFPSATATTRGFGIHGDISGSGDLSLTTSGANSGGGLNVSLGSDMSRLSGDLIIGEASSSTMRVTYTGSALHTGNTVIAASNHQLIFNSESALNYAGAISGSGGITKQGSATLTLSGDNSAFTGTMTLAAGWVHAESQNALGSGTVNITGGGLSVDHELSLGAVAINAGSISLYHEMSADSLSVSGGTLRFFMDEEGAFSALNLNSLNISNLMSLALDMSTFDGIAGNYSLIRLASGWDDISLNDITYNISGYTDDSQVIRFKVIEDELVLNIDYATVWNSDEAWTNDSSGIMEFTTIWEGTVEMSGSLTDKLIKHSSGEHTFIAIAGGEGELTGTSMLNVLGGSLTMASANSYSGATSVGGNGERAELYATAVNALGVGALVVKDQGFVSLTADQGFSSVTVEAGGELSISSAGALGSGFLNNAGILNNENSDDVVLTQSISNTGTLNFNGTGNVDHKTGTLGLNDGTQINIGAGAGDVMIGNLSLSGTQSWNIAEGQYLRMGIRNTNNDGVLSISGKTTINLSGGGMVIIDLDNLEAISSNLNWNITEGSTLTSTSKGVGGHIKLDDGILQANYSNWGGGNASYGSWNYGSQMSLEIGEGGGQYQLYYTAGNSNRYMNLAGAVSGTGDLLVQSLGTTSGTTTEFTFSGDMSAYSGDITLNSAGSNGNKLILDTAKLHTGGIILADSNSMLQFKHDANQNYAGNISGAGTLTKLGSGTLTLSGTNSYTGATRIQAGTVQTNNASALGTGAVSLAGGNLSLMSELNISSLNISSGSLDLKADLNVGSLIVEGGELNFLLQNDVSSSILADSFTLSGLESVDINVDLSSFEGDISRHLLISSSAGWGDITADSFNLNITGYEGNTSNLGIKLNESGLYFVLSGETYWAGGSGDWSSSNWDNGTGSSLTTFTDGGNAFIGSNDDVAGSSNTITLSDDVTVAQLCFSGAGTWVIGEEGTDNSLSLTQAFTKDNEGTTRFEAKVATESAITISAGIAEFAGGVDSTSSLIASGGTTTIAGESSFGSITQNAGAELNLSGIVTANSLRYSNGGLVIKEGAKLTIDSGATATYWTASNLSLEIEEGAVLRHNAFIQLAEADLEITGGGTYELAGIFLGFKNGSGTSLDILEGSTLHITGTDSATSLFANWPYTNTVTVEGNLILDVLLGVNDGATNIVVNSYTNADGEQVGGTLQLSEGLSFSYRYATTTSTITINSGASLIVGSQSKEVSSSIANSKSSSDSDMLKVKMTDGSTLAENGVEEVTTVYHSINYDQGANIAFDAGAGKTLVLDKSLSNINATVQGAGTVSFAGGAALESLNFAGSATLAIAESISTSMVQSTTAGGQIHISNGNDAALQVGSMKLSATDSAHISFGAHGSITDGAMANLNACGLSIATSAGLSITGDVSLSDSELTGGSVKVLNGATLNSSNTSYDAAIELNGGRLNLNESRLNTDISMTAAGTISTS